MADELPTPASRKELYLAKAAGMDVDELPKPASRIEEYLNAIAEGGGGGGGYVLPIASADTLGGVKIGENLNIDANGVLSAAGGGGAAGAFKTLTSADYNWPETGTKNAVALWLLDPGNYYVDNSAGLTTKVKVNAYDDNVYYTESLFTVFKSPQNNYAINILAQGGAGAEDAYGPKAWRLYTTMLYDGSEGAFYSMATTEYLDAKLPQLLNSDWINYPLNNPDGVCGWELSDGDYKYTAPLKIYGGSNPSSIVITGDSGTLKVMTSANKKLIRFTTCEAGDLYEGYTVCNESDGTSAEMKFYTAS